MLAELQTRWARSLLHGDTEDLSDQLAKGPVPAAQALSVHRDTVVSGLTGALRLTFPTVGALVGEDFFDHAALAFARAHPPAGPCLTGYGAAFADFLQAFEPARGLVYLADVARFDYAIDTVGGCSPREPAMRLDLGGADLVLPAALQVLRLDYPAKAIRDAVESDPDALGGIDLAPAAYAYVLWRGPAGPMARQIGPAAAAFLMDCAERVD